MLISFLLFLFVFAAIGISSALVSRGTKQDYYLASGSIKPWLVGLSAVATNNSGYMFIGVIGYTYVTGLASIWLMVGWILGDFIGSLFVHRRLRQATISSGEVSYAGVLGNWYGQEHRLTQLIIGLISLFFLLTYAAAQLVAGSKALHVLLDWPLWSGALVGAVLISLYCFAGGIRASIWTDAAQSVVMIVAMAILLVTAINNLGGISESIRAMQNVDGFLDWFPKELAFPGLLGMATFVLGWLVAGLSVVGQPHIMVRFMTLNDNGKMREAKIWYYAWFSAFYAMATLVGMLARVYLVDTNAFDAELALPTMAMELLPSILVGLILAGVFAATMSTADSLVLSCSAAITHDILPHRIERTWLIKLATLGITAVALLLALSSSQSVFNMVIMAWSGLASAFCPLLIALCFGQRPKEWVCIVAIFAGFLTALIWRFLGLNGMIYEGFPGIIVGGAVLILSNYKR